MVCFINKPPHDLRERGMMRDAMKSKEEDDKYFFKSGSMLALIRLLKTHYTTNPPALPVSNRFSNIVRIYQDSALDRLN
jgi:hypothetical protein